MGKSGFVDVKNASIAEGSGCTGGRIWNGCSELT
jgi:hypothetical protein